MGVQTAKMGCVKGNIGLTYVQFYTDVQCSNPTFGTSAGPGSGQCMLIAPAYELSYYTNGFSGVLTCNEGVNGGNANAGNTAGSSTAGPGLSGLTGTNGITPTTPSTSGASTTASRMSALLFVLSTLVVVLY